MIVTGFVLDINTSTAANILTGTSYFSETHEYIPVHVRVGVAESLAFYYVFGLVQFTLSAVFDSGLVAASYRETEMS